jgi:hypothetical protein
VHTLSLSSGLFPADYLKFWIHVIPPKQRHSTLDFLPIIQIYIHDPNFWPSTLSWKIQNDLPPRVYDHGMPIAFPFLIVGPHLRGCYNISLGLDGSCSQQNLPMGFPGWHCKSRRVCYDLGVLTLQSKTDLWKPELFLVRDYRVSTTGVEKLRQNKSSTQRGPPTQSLRVSILFSYNKGVGINGSEAQSHP